MSRQFHLEIHTDGDGEVHNLNPLIAEHLKDDRGPGLVHIFVRGSTAAITTIEFEPGLIKHDLPALMQRVIPDDTPYVHEATWNDDNGHSHLRASLIGPSVTIPYQDGKLQTGEYQQAVLIEFDTQPRKRVVIVTVMS